MSNTYIGLYEQGAILDIDNDLDHLKIIITVCENTPYEYIFSNDMKSMILNNQFDYDIAVKLCQILEIEAGNKNEMQDYLYISNLIEANPDYDCESWLLEPYNYFMPENELLNMGVIVFEQVYGKFIYYDKSIPAEEDLRECYMFYFSFPLLWEIKEHNNWLTKDEIIEKIRITLKPLFKDNIDWEKRLGYFIGAEYEY